MANERYESASEHFIVLDVPCLTSSGGNDSMPRSVYMINLVLISRVWGKFEKGDEREVTR